MKGRPDHPPRVRGERAERPARPASAESEGPAGANESPPGPEEARSEGRRVKATAWNNDPIGAMFVPWGQTAELGVG